MSEELKKMYDFQPVIMIGAGRSGTKVIRDVIASHPDIDVVPFDVNYIWKIGNQRHPHDQLDPELLTPAIRKNIIRQFSRQSSGAPFLLGKTVSNTLRIPFVLKVFPDARIIHLVRDGRDVVESVMRQWGEVRELGYFFSKLKTFPMKYAVSYLAEYATNWVKFRFRKRGNEDYIWGVKYPGYQEDVRSKSIAEICAIQWKTCVETSLEQLAELDSSRILSIKYEEFVLDPDLHLDQLCAFLDLPVFRDFNTGLLDSSYIGRASQSFDSAEMRNILDIIRPTLVKLKYPVR